MEFGLIAAVLFHALNGIRLILIDFWSQGPRYQRQMLWIVGVAPSPISGDYMTRHVISLECEEESPKLPTARPGDRHGGAEATPLRAHGVYLTPKMPLPGSLRL